MVKGEDEDRYYLAQHFLCYSTLHLDDLDLHLRSQRCEKAKTATSIPHKVVNGFVWSVVCCRHWLVLYLRRFHFSNHRSEEGTLYLCDFQKRSLNFGLLLNIYRPVSFKHGVMIGIIDLCILIPIWMTLIFI